MYALLSRYITVINGKGHNLKEAKLENVFTLSYARGEVEEGISSDTEVSPLVL